jgi:hypothetical protein
MAFVTDEDIHNESKFYDSDKSYELADKFNLCCRKLIFQVLEDKCDSNFPYLNRIKTLVTMLPKAAHYEMISRSKTKLLEHQHIIIKRDKSALGSIQFHKYVKNDEKREFLMSLINLVKDTIDNNKLTESEEKLVWTILNDMLSCCLDFETIIATNKLKGLN